MKAMKYRLMGMAVLVGLALGGCGGGGGSTAAPLNPHFLANLSVPNVSATQAFSFDIGTTGNGKYYLADQNNEGVSVIDINTQQRVTTITGAGTSTFTVNHIGVTIDPVTHMPIFPPPSGPLGVIVTDTAIFAGDVGAVKVIDPATNLVTRSITIPNAAGQRVDEGCYDATHHLLMMSSPVAPPATPLVTIIDTNTFTVVSQVTFNDNTGAPSVGLEQCQYDAATDTFFINNDGTTDHPDGELDRMAGTSIRAIPLGASRNYTTLAGLAIYSEGACGPTGLALGPNSDIAVECAGTAPGTPLLVQILNRNTGAIVASVNAGGGDALAYDPTTNRYYGTSFNWNSTGLVAAPGTPSSPVLSIIDAATRTLVKQLPTGFASHSVAVDPVTGTIFVPYTSPPAPALCATCDANGFTSGGITLFSAK